MLANGNPANFYAVQIANPTMSGSTGSATLYIYKNTGVNTLTQLVSTTVSVHSGMVLRVIMNASSGIEVFVDNLFLTSYYDSSPITALGLPGVGVSGAPSNSGFTAIDIGHLDTVAPSPINAMQVGTSSFPNHVEFQFPGAIDDANGTGVAFYQFWKNGNWFGFSTTTQFSENTVQPGTTYTYG